MSSSSISEIIGGADDGGGIPGDSADAANDRANLAGGGGATDELWFTNLELANFYWGLWATIKVGGITFMWWIYFLAGTRIEKYYWWTWFSSLLVIYGFEGPVAVSWIL